MTKKGDHIKRQDHEPCEAIHQWGWRYHHTGIPTKEKKPGERYLPQLGMYVSGFSTSPYGIEWMRFEEGSPIHPLIQQLPHVAFEVDNVEEEIKKHRLTLLTPLSAPSEGVEVAMIIHNGTPVELIAFDKQIR